MYRANLSSGNSGKLVKCDDNRYIYVLYLFVFTPFLGDLPAAQTSWQILSHDGLKDVELHKGALFVEKLKLTFNLCFPQNLTFVSKK